jgi:hypothetical protein
MAVDEKISQLPEALTLDGEDVVPIVQVSTGLNKRVKVSTLLQDAGFIKDIVFKYDVDTVLEVGKINWVAPTADHTMSVPMADSSYLGKILIVNNRSIYSLTITGAVVSPWVVTGVNSIVGLVCVTNGYSYGWEVFSMYNTGDFDLISQTITNGVTDKSPSEDAVSDALALKADQSSISNIDNTSDANKPISIAGMASHSTGVKTGGVVSIGTGGAGVATTFTIASGVGMVVDNTVTPATLVNVSWSAKTDVAVTNIGTQPITFVAIDSSGNVVQQATDFSGALHRQYIVIGTIIHTNLTTVTAVNQGQHLAISPQAQLNDLFQSLAGFNITGNIFSANGANLNLNKTAGEIFKQGANYSTSANDPNIVVTGSLTVATFRYNNQTGSASGILSAIDPNNYDLAGVTTAVSVNKFTIQRIYLFSSNLLAIQRGQIEYNSLAEAKASIQTETFIVNPSIVPNGVLRSYLIVQQGATALNSATKAFFLEAPKFGGTAGVGGLSVSTLQNAYDNSISPEILTDTTRGAVSVKRGSGADTDTVIEILNGSGTVTSSVDGNGLIYSGQATASTPTFFDSAKKLITTTAQLWGTWVQTWANKATPVDADTIGFYNSASTFVGVKSTLLNLWTTYFKVKADLLYVKLSGLTTNKLLTFDGTNVVSIAGIQLSATWGQLFGYQGTVGSNGSIFSVLSVNATTELLTIKNDGSGVTMNSTRHEFGTLNQVGSIVFDKNLYFSSQVWVRAVDASASNYMHSWINSALGIYGFRYTNTLEARWQSVNTTANTVLQKWSNSAGTQIGVLQNDGLYFGTGTKSTRAILQADSTTQGFLPPRMTSIQKEAIVDTEGLVVYDTDLNALCTNDGVSWTTLGFGAGTTTSSATPTIDTDSINYYELTAQAVDITSFTTNLTGTPKRGQKLWIDITGTAARAITWGASFESSTIALPTTTVTTDKLSVEFIWNVATSKWRCVRTA